MHSFVPKGKTDSISNDIYLSSILGVSDMVNVSHIIIRRTLNMYVWPK